MVGENGLYVKHLEGWSPHPDYPHMLEDTKRA
uniref:Uncharacterized protein n=1 Tax=Arundo donax TaxID=35708 RepID=A0A0A8YJ77_ARUDO